MKSALIVNTTQRPPSPAPHLVSPQGRPPFLRGGLFGLSRFSQPPRSYRDLNSFCWKKRPMLTPGMMGKPRLKEGLRTRQGQSLAPASSPAPIVGASRFWDGRELAYWEGLSLGPCSCPAPAILAREPAGGCVCRGGWGGWGRPAGAWAVPGPVSGSPVLFMT